MCMPRIVQDPRNYIKVKLQQVMQQEAPVSFMFLKAFFFENQDFKFGVSTLFLNESILFRTMHD